MSGVQRFQESKEVFSTDCFITIISTREHKKQIFNTLWIDIENFSKKFSRFDPVSELTIVNQKAGKFVTVSSEFIKLLKVSVKLAKDTQGVFNPLILPALQRSGYVGSWPVYILSNKGTDYSKRDVGSFEKIIIKGNKVKLPANTALDFGGIGKGYLLDKLAVELDRLKVSSFWISLGGDVIGKGRDIDGKPWEIEVGLAENEALTAATVEFDAVVSCSVATSGTLKRKGLSWQHIINPFTGLPSDTKVVSASVYHNSATHADVYAKCCIILGKDRSKEFAKKHNISVLLQMKNGEIVKIGKVWKQ